MPQVDAIVTAGGIPQPSEPLWPLTQGRSKALLDLAGRPMIQWVLDALSGARSVRRVVVMGLREGEAPLRCARPLVYLPNQGAMLANLQAGVRWVVADDPAARHALLVSSDIPAITAAMVDWTVETALQTDDEAYYSLVPREAMERRFPGSKRSYFRFSDGTFTGGDMNMVATRLLTHIPPQMTAIIDARKNIFRQALIVGLDTLLLFALGRLSTKDVERVCSRRLHAAGRVLVCPYAEVGMDVDKPAQYELVRRDFAQRAAGQAA